MCKTKSKIHSINICYIILLTLTSFFISLHACISLAMNASSLYSGMRIDADLSSAFQSSSHLYTDHLLLPLLRELFLKNSPNIPK